MLVLLMVMEGAGGAPCCWWSMQEEGSGSARRACCCCSCMCGAIHTRAGSCYVLLSWCCLRARAEETAVACVVCCANGQGRKKESDDRGTRRCRPEGERTEASTRVLVCLCECVVVCMMVVVRETGVCGGSGEAKMLRNGNSLHLSPRLFSFMLSAIQSGHGTTTTTGRPPPTHHRQHRPKCAWVWARAGRAQSTCARPPHPTRFLGDCRPWLLQASSSDLHHLARQTRAAPRGLPHGVAACVLHNHACQSMRVGE